MTKQLWKSSQQKLRLLRASSKRKITLVKVVFNEKTNLKTNSAKAETDFAEMIFKVVLSFPTTFINVILCFEQDLGGEHSIWTTLYYDVNILKRVIESSWQKQR